MKLNKFNDMITESRYDIHDLFGQEEEEEYSGEKEYKDQYGDDPEDWYDGYGDDEDEDDFEGYGDDGDFDKDVLENLATIIRQMFKQAGLENYYVTTKDYNISIQFVLEKKERFAKLIKITGLLKKLSTDTLIQYESELDLWETTKGNPLLTIDFYYSSGKKGKYDKKYLPK